MKRMLLIFAAIVVFGSLLAGCDLWMDGNYYSVTPHLQDNPLPSQSLPEVSSYDELLNTLCIFVEEGRTSGLVYVNGFTEHQVTGYMDAAVLYVNNSHPVGTYAVDTITYEAGTNTGRMAIALEISYHHSRAEILQIQDAANMSETALLIAAALDNYDASVVINTNEYETTDFVQLVQDYVDNNPQRCMEMPKVSVGVFPEKGSQRIIDIRFTYQTSRDTLRKMQQKVQTVFDSAKMYVSDEAGDRKKFEQLYAFLMERFDYTQQTSITPSYSLLHHGVGDSKAFATVYSAICRQVGLDCRAVSGTRDGAPWHWNVISIEESYYYVDLLRFEQNGDFSPKKQNEMTGYVWDFSIY